MSKDLMDTENNNQEESFADLFEAYSQGMQEDLQIGDMVRGKIISIGNESVYIETGTKIDGVVDKAELLDENRELPFNLGDVIELYVISHDGSEIRLSKSFSGIGGLEMLEEAFQKSVPVEGKVKSECKGGFHVEVMGKRAFCPVSQIDLRYVETPAAYVGEAFPFLITQFDEESRNIVVSRRKLLEKETKKQKQAFFKGITLGMQIEGHITKIMPYGAFVSFMPGIEGMVHLSEISWSRIDNPNEILQIGDRVTVQVIGIEEGKRPGEKKLALSMKQVLGNPWNTVKDTIRMGSIIQGKVTRCTKFGAFVEIAPGIEGLVHISEMSYTKRVLKVDDVVAEGDDVAVMVKDVDVENRRISLSMKDAEGDPWINITKKYLLGQTVNGILEKKERFGYFISLEPGITGLLHKSKIESFHKPSAIEKLSQGDMIPVIVEKIDTDERRISLAPGDAVDEEDWRHYTKGSKNTLGSLGEKLQKALKSNE